MPSIRIIIASNSNQIVKTPVILPSLDSSAAYHTYILKAARDKLRLKKPIRIFVQGGRELFTETDWSSTLGKDVILLVSTGEDYVGNKQEGTSPAHPDSNVDCLVELLAERAFVDSESIKQLENTARTLPGIIHAVGQPDLHPGTKFPIGAVFVSNEWIHPPLIGGDIGCGMAWYQTNLSRSHVEGDKGRKIADRLRGLEGPWKNQETREVWLRNDDDEEVSCSAGEEWDKALGTVGAGNHFAELQVVAKSQMEKIAANAKPTELYEEEVVLLVHSGSRGYGGDILKRFTQDGRVSLHENDSLATIYLREHDRACAWASRNRDLIALRFLSCLEPGDDSWALGTNDSSQSPISHTDITKARHTIQARKVIDIWHNNVEHTSWTPHSPPTSDASPAISPTLKAYIHRKGAAPTHDPQTTTPLHILPLPGSRATPTQILHPTFASSNAHGYTNAFSLAHGAGRAMSRAKAAEYIRSKYKGKSEDLLRGDFVKADKQGNKQVVGEKEGRDVKGGCWVVCEDKELVWEEAMEAYKDVWDVGEDLVGRGCVEIWGWCKPVVCYKVRKE